MNHSARTVGPQRGCRNCAVAVNYSPVDQADRETVFTTKFDATMRERLRALCTEYQCSAAHVIRQLICAEYRHLFPNENTPPQVAPRRTDLDKGRVHDQRMLMARKVRLKREIANKPSLPMRPAPIDGGASVAEEPVSDHDDDDGPSGAAAE